MKLLGVMVLPLVLASCSLFGQPNDKPLAAIVTTGTDHVLSINAPNTGLVAAAIAVRGFNLNVKSRGDATSCFTSLAKDLIYCKFGDLTPYSNSTVTYIGNTKSATLGWDDGQDIAPTYAIPF